MVDDTVECLSVEGRATPVHSGDRQDQWIERYLAKYQPISPDINVDFLRQHLIVEFEPERAFGVIEREEEFSARATRWVFEAATTASTVGGARTEHSLLGLGGIVTRMYAKDVAAGAIKPSEDGSASQQRGRDEPRD